VTSTPDFKVMILLFVFMQLTRDLFAIAKFLLSYAPDKQTNKNRQTRTSYPHRPTEVGVGKNVGKKTIGQESQLSQ